MVTADTLNLYCLQIAILNLFALSGGLGIGPSFDIGPFDWSFACICHALQRRDYSEETSPSGDNAANWHHISSITLVTGFHIVVNLLRENAVCNRAAFQR